MAPNWVGVDRPMAHLVQYLRWRKHDWDKSTGQEYPNDEKGTFEAENKRLELLKQAEDDAAAGKPWKELPNLIMQVRPDAPKGVSA